MNIFKEDQRFSCSSITYLKPSAFGPRQQEDLQLVYVYEGDMTVQVDARTYSIGAGEATLLLPGHREHFRFAEKSVTRHGWCTATRPELPGSFIKSMQERPDRLSFSEDMRTLAMLAEKAPARDPGQALYRDGLIRALLLEFISRAGLAGGGDAPLHPAVAKAAAYIEHAAPGPMTVRDMARAANITPAHLIRLFREAFGMTPKAYYWRHRTGEAARMLRETGLTAAEIAYRTGFANPHHFSRVFKQYRGESPGRYRLRKWG